MICNGYTTFRGPLNLTEESMVHCSEDLISFNDSRRDFITYCVDEYLDSDVDVYIFGMATLGAFLCLVLSLALSPRGNPKLEKKESVPEPKGQLISKCPFGFIVSTKTPAILLRISILASKKRSNQKSP